MVINKSHYKIFQYRQPQKKFKKKIINGELHGSCCNKLIKRSACENIGFHPDEISLCEDELFNIKVLNNDIKVTHLPKAFYHYLLDNPTSIIHSNFPRQVKSMISVIKEYEKILDKESFDNFFVKKKMMLDTAFIMGQLSFLWLFPEIHQRITQNAKYHFFTPYRYFLSMALKGHPYLAYYLYKINLCTLHFFVLIKQLLSKHNK